jgi:hypothetical protein
MSAEAMGPTPVLMDRPGLLAVLDDIRSRVESGDSLEGNCRWSIPDDDDAPPGTVDVVAMYRVGNLQKQPRAHAGQRLRAPGRQQARVPEMLGSVTSAIRAEAKAARRGQDRAMRLRMRDSRAISRCSGP